MKRFWEIDYIDVKIECDRSAIGFLDPNLNDWVEPLLKQDFKPD